MRPAIGISLELFALACTLAIARAVPSGPVYYLYLLVAQFLATYLIHCPAHYVAGRFAGIRFRSIRIGRTTLTRALPARFKSLGRLLPILTLSTEKASLSGVSRPRIKAMYFAGTVASSGSAFFIAAAVAFSGLWVPSVLTWTLAIGYLLFDIVFSPKSGDVMRARALVRS